MSLVRNRIKSSITLGKIFESLSKEQSWPGFEIGLSEVEYSNGLETINMSVHHNGWFTKQSVQTALSSWAKALTKESLEDWLSHYEENNTPPKKIGIIAAGNIPMVGLHDILCILLSGNSALIKLSSKDAHLMMMVIGYLQILDPDLKDSIQVVHGKLEGFDAVIATGSNNSSRYFEYYFKDKPSIIRKNRTSVAVLTGDESKEEMSLLGKDIFTYFGLGCRNVTKLYLLEGYDLDKFFTGIYEFKEIGNHNKYANNYDYHRAIWLLNGDDLLENGFILFKQDESLVSPVGTLYYEFYSSKPELAEKLNDKKEQIQCVVSADNVPFGKAQEPELMDYPDGVDTMEFLLALK